MTKNFLIFILVAFLCILFVLKAYAHQQQIITQFDIRKVKVSSDTTCYYYSNHFSCVKG